MKLSHTTIHGRSQISGNFTLSESVESAKCALWAGIMTETPTKITNPPDCKSLTEVIDQISFLGAEISTEKVLEIHGEKISTLAIPKNTKLLPRDAILLWAALLAKFKRAGIPKTIIAAYPEIAPVLTAFDVRVELQNEYVVATYESSVSDRTIEISNVVSYEKRVLVESVALIMAATSSQKTKITQVVASQDHENLTEIFTKMGVSISGEYPDITVVGVELLVGISYALPKSVAESLLVMSLVCVSTGDVTIRDFPTRQLARMTKRFQEKGATFSIDRDVARIWSENRRYFPTVQTFEEAFRLPSEWQTVLCVLGAYSEGESNLYMHHDVAEHIVPVLISFGAQVSMLNIDDDYSEVRVFGPTELHATNVTVTSYEAELCAVLCAQSAKGVSTITSSSYIANVHEHIYEKLTTLGMKISHDDEQ